MLAEPGDGSRQDSAPAAVPPPSLSLQQQQPQQLQQQQAAKRPLPKFVGHRRRLLPDAPLFEYANIERQLALQDSAVKVRCCVAHSLLPAYILLYFIRGPQRCL